MIIADEGHSFVISEKPAQGRHESLPEPSLGVVKMTQKITIHAETSTRALIKALKHPYTRALVIVLPAV